MPDEALRYVDHRINEALGHFRQDLQPFWSLYSRPWRVFFPDMNTKRDIAHGMNAIPDGFFLVYADADIIAEPGVFWDRDLAYLRAGAMNARAIVIFYTLREVPADA